MKFKSNIEIQAGLEDSSGSPGTVNQLLSSTVTGTAWIDPTTIVAEAATLVVIACKNTSGAAIAQGTPVYQTGTVGATATIEIAPADALISTGDLPAIGLLQTALNNNGFGFVVISGALTNFTTSPIDGVVPVTGDKVFLKSGGGLTLTKPTGEGNGIQNMGLVGKVSSGNSGSITVSSIMRTNDVPNLPEGRIWVGDGNTLVSDTVYVDEPNLRLGIGTISPGAKLDVSGDVLIDSGEYLSWGTVGAISIEGSTASNKLQFRTSSTDRMIINDTGVGIGTTSPTSELTIKANTPQIDFTDSTGNDVIANIRAEIDSGTGGKLVIQTKRNGNTALDRVAIDDDGNVGIGTTNPDSKLTIGANGVTTLKPTAIITDTTNGGSLVLRGQSPILAFDKTSTGVPKILMDTGGLQFKTGTLDAEGDIDMVILPDGNVGIGTTSPSAKLDVKETTSDVAGEIIVGGLIASDNVPFGKISFANTASTNAQTNDILASIAGEKVGSSNRGELTFSTSDSAAPAERMRIDSSGDVGIGTTSPGYKLDVSGDGRFTGTVHSNKLEYGGSSSTYLDFGINSITLATGSTSALSINSGQNVFIDAGSLTVTTSTVTATNFILSSDERLKENIEKARDNRIKADWKTFELKTEKGQKRYGVIAQELEKTNPEFVREDTRGFKSVAYIDLLIAKIAELETRLEKAGI